MKDMGEYYAESIIPMIEAKYDSFTSTEREIADFFIHNSEMVDFSARAVAARLYVSKASLSRFAQKCGYRGYREFIYRYEESFVKKKTAETGHTRTVMSIYQDFLNAAYNLMDGAQIARVAKYLNKAEQVYVCGKGSSGLSASEMESRFMRIGINIDSIQDSDRMRMQSVFLNNRNLVIGISVSGNAQDVLYLLKEAHGRGATTVLMTAKSRESFDEYCDEVLLLPSMGHLEQGNVISPQFPILLMIDILYLYIYESDKNVKEGLHTDTLWALHKNKTMEGLDER